MLWEMLAGRRLWQGMNEVQIVSQLAAGLPFPPLPSDAEFPPGLDAICERALDPIPDRRYQTAAEMEEDLERVLIGSEDSHARNLGRVVSLAFAAERAARQGLIEASSRLEVGADIPMAPPQRDAEPEVTPSGTQRSQTPGRTTPAEPIVARSTPAQAIEAQQSQGMPSQAMPYVDVVISDRDLMRSGGAPAVASPAPTPAPEAPTGRHTSSRGRRVGLRRTVVVAGLMAIAALLVRFDGGAKRLVFIGQVAAPAAVAQPVAPPPSPPAAVTPQVAPRKPALHVLDTVTLHEWAGPRDPQPPRSRRRHHEPLVDEDATMPPTPELSGEGEADILADPPDPALPHGRRAPASVPRLQ
jgi:serine/threonine-protein kinase